MTEKASSNHNNSFLNQPQSQTIGINKYDTRGKKINLSTIGDKFSLTGKQCHYCKNTLTVQNSTSCKSKLFIPKQRYLKIDSEKINFRKKNCSKKFCNKCLSNNFPSFYESIKDNNWKCPCCADQCNCSSCKKIKSKNVKIQNEKSLLSNSESHLDYMTDNKSETSYLKETSFDWNILTKILGKVNKEKIIGIQKTKTDIPDSMFLKYKRSRDEYFETIRRYKIKNEKGQIEENEGIEMKEKELKECL